MKKKSLYEKGYRPLLSITIPGKCDETVVKRYKNEFEKRIEKVVTALRDLYLDEEESEGTEIPKIELNEDNLTDDFTAMIMAVHLLYIGITGDDTDLIGFTHIANRLVFQWLLENGGKEKGES